MAESDGRARGTLLLYGRSGPFRLEASLERAFRSLGWRVVRFDADPEGGDLTSWIRTRLGRRLTRRSLSLRRLGARARNAAFRRKALALGPDLVLLVNGAFVMPETVTCLRREGLPVAVFHPDAPVPGNPNHRPEHRPTARQADVCFVWSRGLCRRLEDDGARRAVYLPFGWDREVFPHVGYRGNDRSKVVFVGGWDRHRERYLEAVARRFELDIWGPGYWGSRTRLGSPLRDCWKGRALRGPEASNAVARAAISLNVLREQNLPDGTNMRTFEIPGAGGFQLSTRTSGATEIYPENEAAGYFGSVEELLEKIGHYLARADERRRIALQAHRVTERRHRYLHRAWRIVKCVEGVEL